MIKKRVIQASLRIILYTAGLFFIALGVAFSINSDLGVSPVNALPYSIAEALNVSAGTCVIAVFITYMAIQAIILRRGFKPKNLTQILFSIIFGYFVDFTRFLVGDFVIPTYLGRLAMILIAMTLISFGIALYLNAELIPMPMEGLALAVSQKLPRLGFHRTKIVLDCLSVALAALIGLLTSGTLTGVREGTVISAICTGKILSIFMKHLKPLNFAHRTHTNLR